MHRVQKGCILWQSEFGTRQHFAYREAEPYGANVNASYDSFNKRLQQKMVEPEMGLCAAIRTLQFLQTPTSLQKSTPAMASGLTGHVWTIQELITSES
jgi:hypothetical protein